MAVNKGGRPSKMTEELLKKAEGYLEFCKANPLIRTVFTKQGPVEIEVPKPPTMTELATYLDVSRETVHQWSNPKSDYYNARFSDVYTRVRQEYERVLVENGLTDKYNANLARFLLASDHDKRDKADVTTAGKEMPTPILAPIQNAVSSDDSDKEDTGAHEES